MYSSASVANKTCFASLKSSAILLVGMLWPRGEWKLVRRCRRFSTSWTSVFFTWSKLSAVSTVSLAAQRKKGQNGFIFNPLSFTWKVYTWETGTEKNPFLPSPPKGYLSSFAKMANETKAKRLRIDGDAPYSRVSFVSYQYSKQYQFLWLFMWSWFKLWLHVWIINSIRDSKDGYAYERQCWLALLQIVGWAETFARKSNF